MRRGEMTSTARRAASRRSWQAQRSTRRSRPGTRTRRHAVRLAPSRGRRATRPAGCGAMAARASGAAAPRRRAVSVDAARRAAHRARVRGARAARARGARPGLARGRLRRARADVAQRRCWCCVAAAWLQAARSAARADARAGDPLVLETGTWPPRRGFTLPSPWYLPLVQLRWRWTAPLGASVELAPRGRRAVRARASWPTAGASTRIERQRAPGRSVRPEPRRAAHAAAARVSTCCRGSPGCRACLRCARSPRATPCRIRWALEDGDRIELRRYIAGRPGALHPLEGAVAHAQADGAHAGARAVDRAAHGGVPDRGRQTTTRRPRSRGSRSSGAARQRVAVRHRPRHLRAPTASTRRSTR